MNDKRAGDVKRYDVNIQIVDGEKYVTMQERNGGSWIAFKDIAHLLKPQEPVVNLNDKIFGKPEPITKDDHDFLDSVTGKPQESAYDSSKSGTALIVHNLEQKCRQIMAENRRLRDALERFVKRTDTPKDLHDICLEALNSGGVK